MAYTYKINSNSADSQQSTPYWLALVVPFQNKVTYNFYPTDPKSKDVDGVAVKDYYVLDKSIIGWSTSSSKGGPNSGLQLTLRYMGLDYTRLFADQDWILFWAFTNYDDYITVKENIKNGLRVNGFKNAPKFIGRITSVMDALNVAPDGKKRLSFTIGANGFVEFTSKIYHHPLIKLPGLPINMSWSRFQEKAGILAGYAAPSDSVPLLLEVMLGAGPGKMFKGDSDVRTSPNDAFKIPPLIGQLLLGTKSKTLYYSDIINPIVGVQSYSEDSKFQPSKLTNLRGLIAGDPVNFNNQTIWSILSNFSAYPINEMYTCLRVNSEGFVVPTLVCRQTPFVSEGFKVLNSQSLSSETTTFIELPRWEIDESMVTAHSLGTNGAVRINYLQYVGYTTFQPDIKAANEFDIFKPIMDVQDINRAGLQPDIQKVPILYVPGNKDRGDNSAQQSSVELGQYINNLFADIKMEGHLKFSGSITCKGIQEPVCEGDNLVYRDGIYHIERIQHAGAVDGNGKKEFVTIFFLSNGISIKSDNRNNYKDYFRNIYLNDDVEVEKDDLNANIGFDYEEEM